MSVESDIRELAERWEKVPAGERANYQLYLLELAEALDVPRPDPKGSGYEFEYPISVVTPTGSTTTKFADLYRAGYFLLEAKDENPAESRDILLRRAFGQARLYAAWVKAPPPYLLALDVGRTLMVWDRWSGAYGDYHAGYRIYLPTLADRPDDIALLQDIWTDPAARDPRGRSEAITREVAADLARLSTSLEKRGHEPEVVARFLIRCVFSMFAEDVGLLPGEPFRRAIQEVGLDDPAEFPETVTELWQAMDRGGRFGLRKFLRFNGHFFKEQTALPLTKADLEILLGAAKLDWADVEPSIMGTLLTRALNPAERHRLGAEYTPREYVERLVRPTVEEPIRERWTRVQAEVLQLRSATGKAARATKGRDKKALESLRSFHEWLRGLRFLDPACGSGNFLYVTLNLVKQIEFELLRAIEEITGHPELAVEEVGPWQFHGIEVKAWARELAELTLWIGFHQWWRRAHGHIQPPEPVLRDTGTLEQRDAVLDWMCVHEDTERSRYDRTARIRHPVTGQLVPDPAARVPYLVHEDAAPAPWPRADFIVGNPPYMGDKRMREHFGDGYVDALRSVYPAVPASADYVMHWWHRAAAEVASGRTIRAGLITTNSIGQTFNRRVIDCASEAGARIRWAIPDHPWVDEAEGAAIRIAMTVIARDPDDATLVHVDERGRPVREVSVPKINADLTAHADVAGAAGVPLRANEGLAGVGFALHGQGFIVEESEALALLAADERSAEVLRPYRNGRDITQRLRNVYVIDFGLRTEDEAREYPVLYDMVRTRVKPDRDTNRRESRRLNWWLFGEPTPSLRAATRGLTSFIVTPMVAKHRMFVMLEGYIATDQKLVVVATDSMFMYGVLNAAAHLTWADAAGGTLEDRPTYNKTKCFDPFPFPNPAPELRRQIEKAAERVHLHRERSLSRDPKLTMTDLYNVVAKVRSGGNLSASDRRIHDAGACGVLRDLHDELDLLVASAYGWAWPMEREEILAGLVALHDERLEEEKAGTVRWIRPEYQVPRFGEGVEEEQTLDLGDEEAGGDAASTDWPASTIEQIAALQALLASGPVSIEHAAARFRGARRDHVARHLETLALMGEATQAPDGAYHLARTMAVAA